uniref:Uncharacterized protein n=1 Tax=Opuntia streptacantha TaxID=393608 RepID=A0A7C8ZD87_OPUST
MVIGQGGGEKWRLERQSAVSGAGRRRWLGRQRVSAPSPKQNETEENRGGRAEHGGRQLDTGELSGGSGNFRRLCGRRQRPGAGSRRQREEGEEKEAKRGGSRVGREAGKDWFDLFLLFVTCLAS